MPYKVFVNGFPLNASELNTFLMQQSISVFADASARDAAITSPIEGQYAHLTASDALTRYTGTAWETLQFVTAADVSTKTANYTLAASDTNDLIQVNGSYTITVPASTFATGTRVDVANIGTGTVTFAGSGLTLQSKESKVTLTKQYSAATLFFTSATTALLVGDLA